MAILAEEHYPVMNYFSYAIAPAPDGDAYLVYVNDQDGYSAQRLGPNCKNKWANPVVVDATSVVSREAISPR